jgi:RNA polymerase sigma factor (sigma-70 family)
MCRSAICTHGSARASPLHSRQHCRAFTPELEGEISLTRVDEENLSDELVVHLPGSSVALVPVIELLDARSPTASFDQLYRREYVPLLALAVALVGRRETAEDVVQEAMFATAREWPRVQALDKPGAWTRRVVINKSLSWRRRQVVELKALTRLSARPEIDQSELEGSTAFWNAVRRLPRQQMIAVALRYVDDLSMNEIGELLGCSEATVRVHLFRARQALEMRLVPDGF